MAPQLDPFKFRQRRAETKPELAVMQTTCWKIPSHQCLKDERPGAFARHPRTELQNCDCRVMLVSFSGYILGLLVFRSSTAALRLAIEEKQRRRGETIHVPEDFSQSILD
jgi:hypothetical protein